MKTTLLRRIEKYIRIPSLNRRALEARSAFAQESPDLNGIVRAVGTARRLHPVVKLVVLLALCLLVNLLCQWRSPHRVEFSSEATRVSLAIQNGRGFADPYLTGPSGPTAQMAPLYPYLHAAVCLAFGTGFCGWLAVVFITSASWALQWYCGYLFAALFGQDSAGFAAAVLGVLIPLPGRVFKWDAPFTGLAIAISAWLLAKILNGDTRVQTLTALGAALASGVLLAPALLATWPFYAILIARHGVLGQIRAARVLMIVAAVAIVPPALWTVRNGISFGHFIPIRDAGMAVGSSWNDCAAPVVYTNIVSGCFAREHPSGSTLMLERLRVVGEYNFSAQQMTRAKRWIKSHPAQSTRLLVGHIAFFWFPLDPDSRLLGVGISVMTVLSLLSLMWYRSPGFWILVFTLLPYSFTYYLVQVEQRYRYPVIWISVVLACIGIKLVMERLQVKAPKPPPSERSI